MPSIASVAGQAPRPSLLDVSRQASADSIAVQLQAVARQAGRPPMAVVRSFAKLTMGRGKISFQDFVRLRLFDAAVQECGDLDAFVGQKLNRNMCVAINFRHDWLGLMANKVASAGYLATYGLPTAPIAAIYAPQADPSKANLLGSADDLERFLMGPDHYPLFGKPVESYQSLGSIALTGVDQRRRELIRFDGSAVGVHALVADIQAHYQGGYLFQPMLTPHPDVARLCGERLATVRVLTIATEDGPQVFRTCWKIPAGSNVADNYWRTGNLLAQLDSTSGEVKRVTSGHGLGMAEHVTHPDTRIPLVGFRHPDWQAMLDLARDGARLMRHVPLIGWDIAATAEGPVIIEMNETPDFFLPQFADQTGVLGSEFAAFMAYQKRRGDEHRRAGKALVAKL